MSTQRHLLDLGVADVHQPAPVRGARKKVSMAKLPTKTRNALGASSFALPAQRKYPINDANHTRDAAARLQAEHGAGKISDGDYAEAKKRIAAAAKKFGIDSKFNKAKGGKRKARSVRVQAHLGAGGSLSVRHLSDAIREFGEGSSLVGELASRGMLIDDVSERIVHVEGAVVALADDPAKPVWIQLAKPGVFRGHPAGPFELNGRVFDDIIRNFKATENQAIPIDFEHASESDPTEGSIPTEGAPAQGWIRDLKIGADGNLYGLVDWGTKAREYIRDGQYRYFSPAIRFGAKDRVTGEKIGARMTSGALTNNPFLDGMKPLAAKDTTVGIVPTHRLDGLSRARESKATSPSGVAEIAAPLLVTLRTPLAHEPHEYLPALKAALKLPELCSARECSDQLDRLRDHLDLADGNPKLHPDGVDLASYLTPLRSLVGATPGTTWEEVFDVVQDLIDAATEQHVIEDPGGQAEDLESEVATPAEAAMDDDGDGGGDDGGDDAAMADRDTTDHRGELAAQETMNMDLTKQVADISAKNGELTVSLKDVSTKLSDAETKLADVTLSLKDEVAKREAAEKELVELRDKVATREKKDHDDRVGEAFDTYKDDRKLTDDDKEMMSLLLKSNPEKFEKRYPKVAPSQKHLMRSLTEGRDKIAPAQHIDDGTPVRRLSLRELSRQIAQQKRIPLDQAQRIAYRQMTTPRPPAR